jgi:hypothetical protein
MARALTVPPGDTSLIAYRWPEPGPRSSHEGWRTAVVQESIVGVPVLGSTLPVAMPLPPAAV